MDRNLDKYIEVGLLQESSESHKRGLIYGQLLAYEVATNELVNLDRIIKQDTIYTREDLVKEVDNIKKLFVAIMKGQEL